jgi:hypothetical protein
MTGRAKGRVQVQALRKHLPDFWAEVVRVARDEIGLAAWTEDQIETVLRKLRVPSPDVMPDHIGHVLCWCKAAQDGPEADDETRATVDLWLHPDLPIVITVGDDGRIGHRIDPDVTVELLP